MSYSYTLSDSTTFTLTHAKHISAKVATDLKRMQRFYKEPIDSHIASYETEVIELLKAGYLDIAVAATVRTLFSTHAPLHPSSN